jgi:hypothetical protein
VAVQTNKARVCGGLLAGNEGSNSAGGMDVYLVSVVCYQVEVTATGRPLVQSLTECGVSKARIARVYFTCY